MPERRKPVPVWPWALGAVIAAAMTVAYVRSRRRREKGTSEPATPPTIPGNDLEEKESPAAPPVPAAGASRPPKREPTQVHVPPVTPEQRARVERGRMSSSASTRKRGTSLFGANVAKMAAANDMSGLLRVAQGGQPEDRARAIEAFAEARELDALATALQSVSAASLPQVWKRGIEAILRMAPKDAEQVTVALLSADLKEEDEASALDALLRVHSIGEPNFWAQVGATLLGQGRVESALRCFREAVKVAPPTKELIGSIGASLIDAQRWAPALEFFEHYSALDPDDPRGWGGKGLCLSNLERLEDAKAACTKAIELQPTYALARNTLGVVYAKLGENEALMDFSRESVELDPANVKARCLLTEVLMLADKLVDAETEAQEMLAVALAAESTDPETLAMAYSQLGTIAVMRGHDGALPYFEKAIQANQRDPSGYNLADACAILDMMGSLSQGTPQQRRARLLGFAQQRGARYSSYAEWKARSGT